MSEREREKRTWLEHATVIQSLQVDRLVYVLYNTIYNVIYVLHVYLECFMYLYTVKENPIRTGQLRPGTNIGRACRVDTTGRQTGGRRSKLPRTTPVAINAMYM